MSPAPITLVRNTRGEVVHSCLEAGCGISWDGYALKDGLEVEQPDPKNPDATVVTRLAKGERLPGAFDPGEEWDTSTDGVAQRKPPAD